MELSLFLLLLNPLHFSVRQAWNENISPKKKSMSTRLVHAVAMVTGWMWWEHAGFLSVQLLCYRFLRGKRRWKISSEPFSLLRTDSNPATGLWINSQKSEERRIFITSNETQFHFDFAEAIKERARSWSDEIELLMHGVLTHLNNHTFYESELHIFYQNNTISWLRLVKTRKTRSGSQFGPNLIGHGL